MQNVELPKNKERQGKQENRTKGTMGLSSSQARLLTLTDRLHDIEYRAQKIEAEKLRLANNSTRVYEDYLLALDKTKIMAKILTSDGSFTNTELTAAKIYNYQELMGQYSLKTADDKTLISESLSNTYKNTDSLSDFLEAYGLYSTYTQTVHHVVDNEDYLAAENNYENAHSSWEDRYNSYLEDHAKWVEEQAQYVIDYEEWAASEPDADDTTQEWWTTSTDDSLGSKWASATSGCYSKAVGGTISCYKHVLAYTIDFIEGKGLSISSSGTYSYNTSYTGNYQTSTGTGFTIGYSQASGSTISSSSSQSQFQDMAEVSETICTPDSDGNYILASVADDETCDVDDSSSEFEKLISKWNTDGTVKSLYQWAIDLMYVCEKTSGVDGYDATTMTATITAFQNAMVNSLTEFNEEVYYTAVSTWESEAPTLRSEPTFTEAEPQEEDYVGDISPTREYDETVDHTTFNDKNLAQWYINLWYKMEGEDDVPSIQEETIYDSATSSYVTIYSVENKAKSETTYSTNEKWDTEENENYVVIKDEFLNDPTWLYNAIQEGLVIIQEYSSSSSAFVDTSVAVNTMLVEVQDETYIKKAEAKYEADMNAINKKDARYDTELATVETEREAIVDEIDTLKTVAKDNVDRTFKLFS